MCHTLIISRLLCSLVLMGMLSCVYGREFVQELACIRYGLGQASNQRHGHLMRCSLILDFFQCLADTEKRDVYDMIIPLQFLAVGKNERCDQFGTDLNEMLPINNLGESRWYSACVLEKIP